jgi:outer membrane protein assembly factor BamB
VLYVVTADGHLYAVDQRAGGRELIRRLDGGATGALAATADTVAVADSKGTVWVVNATTGRLLRSLRTDGQVLGAPLLTAGRVYAAGTDGRLHWADIAGERDGQLPGLGSAPVHVAPVGDGERLYLGASDGRVLACDLRERDSQVPLNGWASRPLGAEIAGLALAGEKLYAAAGSRIFALDSRTGEVEDRPVIELNCLIGAAPVIAAGFGYAVGLGGVVARVELR